MDLLSCSAQVGSNPPRFRGVAREMAAGLLQQAKRAFVAILRELIAAYGLAVAVTRDSTDDQVTATFRRVARAAHPDKGGRLGDSQRLHSARDAWEAAKAQHLPRGRRPRKKPAAQQEDSAGAPGMQVVLPTAEAGPRREYRVCSQAALFTYQGFSDLAQWRRFVAKVKASLKTWSVKHWSATLETNRSDGMHAHLMLQFRALVDRSLQCFIFEGLRPNVSQTDILGDGFARPKLQLCIDRAMFYVWANKIGTVRDDDGRLCVAGNYVPCWVPGPFQYQVLGAWPEKLWKQRKLAHDVYEEYLFLSRDGVPGRKRNFEAVREREAQIAEQAEIAATTKRLRSTPSLYKSFPEVPEAAAWLKLFKSDQLRYPILVVLGPSFSGKTEWAKSLFTNPLELKVGSLAHFPDRMRLFDRRVHDGIVLDDVRDLQFVADNQEKLQGKYDAAVEFATTPGGTCSYTKYLFAIPAVVTINFSTKNLQFLETHDWLSNASNRVVVHFQSFAA